MRPPLALAVALCIASGARGQAPALGPAPITVHAATPIVDNGTPISIFGRTVSDGKPHTITVIVTYLGLNPGPVGEAKAAGPPVSLRAPLSPNGSFGIAFDGTDSVGRYRVEAIALDGKGRDTASFRALGSADDADQTATIIDSALSSTERAFKMGCDQLKTLPPSPAIQSMLEQCAPIERDIGTCRTSCGADITAWLDAVPEAIRREVNGDIRPLTDSLRVQTRVLDDLVDRGAKTSELCDQLVIVEEGFKYAAALFKITGALTRVVVSKAEDLVGFPTAKPAPAWCGAYCQYIETQVKRSAIAVPRWVQLAAGKKDFAMKDGATLASLASRAAAFGTDEVFHLFCIEFAGPVTGTMHAEFFEHGVKWWTYDVTIKGRLSLHWRKGANLGDGVRVSGQLTGSGTDFEVWDSSLVVFYPKLLRGARLVGHTVPPVGLPYTEKDGIVLASELPTGFFIPVDGGIKGETMVLHFEPARTDFLGSYAQARGGWVIFSPLSLVPVFTGYDLPYKNGSWIVTHATSADLSADVPFDLTIANDRISAHKAFHRDKPGSVAHGIYDLTVSLCTDGRC